MSVLRRFTNLFRRSDVDRDIADELQSHIDLRIESNLASGMSPDDARREALLRFGNPTSTKERVTASSRSPRSVERIACIRRAVDAKHVAYW